MRFRQKFISATDSYKLSHHLFYPPNAAGSQSYLAARTWPLPWRNIGMVFFGLQPVLRNAFAGSVVSLDDVYWMKKRVAKHLGRGDVFNEAGWTALAGEKDGQLPLSIRALPEGTVAPVGTVLLTIEPTDPNFVWLVSHVEDYLVQLWNTCTVATYSRVCKHVIREYLDRTSDTIDKLPWMLNDFGLRGVGGMEVAAMLGAAHLVNFRGTDNLPALDLVSDCYSYDPDYMAGDSLRATEHSTICSWPTEEEAFENLLDRCPDGLVACVSDSRNIFDACRYWGGPLKERVLARNGTLVVRPDSGQLPETLLQVFETLGEAFGTKPNGRGYRLLPAQVRTIQGDRIDLETLTEILYEMEKRKWSVENTCFGSGGGLLQRHDRDVLGFTMKQSSITLTDGSQRDVFKTPATDAGKNSKRGLLKVIQTVNGLETVNGHSNDADNKLVEVFRDGEVLYPRQQFEDIRKRAELE